MPELIFTCLICCAAVFLFFIALAIYSIARGGMFVRVGNVRMRPSGRSGYGGYNNGPDEHSRKLEAIRGSEKVLCEKCGEWADSGDSYCPKCGAPLEKR